MKNYIMVFKNTHDAIEGERIFNSNSIKMMIMPTPTYITHSCGISIRFAGEELNSVEELLNNNKISFKNVYELTQEGFNIYK